jgi:hypothetical protein
MGLHCDQTLQDLSSEQVERRKRLFFSVYMMDRLVSITLGRPFAIHEDDIDVAVRIVPERCQRLSTDTIILVIFCRAMQRVGQRHRYFPELSLSTADGCHRAHSTTATHRKRHRYQSLLQACSLTILSGAASRDIRLAAQRSSSMATECTFPVTKSASPSTSGMFELVRLELLYPSYYTLSAFTIVSHAGYWQGQHSHRGCSNGYKACK